MNTPRRRFYALAPDPWRGTRFSHFHTSYVRKRDLMLRRYATILLVFMASSFLILLSSSKEEYLILGDAAVSEKSQRQEKVPNITFSPGVLRGGVSLVSACKDKHETLRVAIPSWTSVKTVSEIILVDWSSTPSLRYVLEEIDNLNPKHPPLYVIHVDNQTRWHPSRAFNLGIRAAHFSQVIKVDCDHKVREDFVANHPLPKDAFFAGSRKLERGSFDENLRGTMFIAKKDFLRNGGYDERIPDNMGGQEDLLKRLQQNHLKRIDIDYDTLLQTSGSYPIKDFSQRLKNTSEEMETKVNLELLRSLPIWTGYMAWKSFTVNVNISAVSHDLTPSHSHSNVYYKNIQVRSNVPSLRTLLNPDQIGKTRGEVLNQALNSEFQLPKGLLRAMPFPIRKKLVQRLGDKKNVHDRGHIPRVLFLHCVGKLLKRIHCLASGLSFAEQTGFIPVLIWLPEPGETSNVLGNLFEDISSLMVVEAFEIEWSPWKFFESSKESFSKSLSFQDMTTNASGTIPITSNSKMALHRYITARGALTSELTRHTSEHAMQRQLKQFEICGSIKQSLQKLEDRGLSSAVGIYTPSEFERINKTEREVFLAEMRKRYDEFTNWDARATKVYVDGFTRMEGFLRDEFSTLILAPRAETDCERKASVCEKNILTRVYALAETARFWYPELETDAEGWDFVSLVRILRGDSFSW